MGYEFVPQFSRMLKNLSHLLDKAQTHAEQKKYDSAVYVHDRLAPDMLDFSRQIQIACDTAKFYAARLTGKEKEAPKFDDSEKTFPELKERIRKTIAYLETVKKEDFEGWETRKTTNPRREGKYLPGYELAMHQAIPNLYFHITTAYAILRLRGVDVGKMDYLGELNWRPL